MTFQRSLDGPVGTFLMTCVMLVGAGFIYSGIYNALNPTAPDARAYILDFGVRLFFGLVMLGGGGLYFRSRITARKAERKMSAQKALERLRENYGGQGQGATRERWLD